MSKSIKLTDNTYWDTKGIIHNKQNLYNFLDNISNGVIVDTFESASGRYIKYSNGIMIQTKVIYNEISFHLWYGSVAYFDSYMGDWLVPFKSSNLIILVGDYFKISNGGNQMWSCQSPQDISATSAGTCRALRVSDEGMTDVVWRGYIMRTCIGFWK